MYDRRRTTFAHCPHMPTRTSPQQLRSVYHGLCKYDPWFNVHDLDRHVLAIDVRRFELAQIEDALDGVVLSNSFCELEIQLDDLLVELIECHGDPTQWPVLLHHLPPLVTTGQPHT